MSAEPAASVGGAPEPFIETRAGGLFFVNAVLAGPALLVLWPVLLRAMLGEGGAPGRIAALLDVERFRQAAVDRYELRLRGGRRDAREPGRETDSSERVCPSSNR